MSGEPCTYCGTAVAAGAASCGTCGRPVARLAETRVDSTPPPAPRRITAPALAPTPAVDADAEVAKLEVQLSGALDRAERAEAAAAAQVAARARSRPLGFAVMAGAVAIGFVVGWQACGGRATSPPPGPAVAPIVAAPPAHTGDRERPVSAPDTIASWMSELRTRGAPHGRLVKYAATAVRPDGTLDPAKGKLEAIFLKDAPPLEATTAPPPPPSARPLVCRAIRRTAEGWTEDAVVDTLCVLYRDARIYEPRCSMKTIWALARERGAPDGLADLEYKPDGTWWFFMFKPAGGESVGQLLPDYCR